MFNYKRKNNALNNAASGLERGLQTGIGLGMQARRQQQDEEQAQFQRDQALKQAKRVDDELQLEDQGRQAESQAIGEIADTTNPWDSAKRPFVGPAIATAGVVQQSNRVKSIAQELARRGKSKEAWIFLSEARAKMTRQADEDHRAQVMDRIAHAMRDGSLFGTNPDGSKIENENINGALKRLTEGISKPDIPAAALELQLNQLQAGAAKDQNAFDNKNTFVDGLRKRFASVGEQQQQQMGPQTAESSIARHKQQARMNSLINNAVQFYPIMFPAKPTPESAKMAAQYMEQVSLTEQGYAGYVSGPVDPMTGQRMKIPYTFEQEDGIHALMQDMQRTKMEAEQAKAELDRIKADIEAKRGPLLDAQAEKARADAAAVPTNAEAKRMDAQANLNRSNNPRTSNAEDNRNDARLKAHPLFKDKGVPSWAFKNPEIVDVLETLPEKVLALGAEKAKAFYDAVQDVPPEKRDQFLEDWLDENK